MPDNRDDPISAARASQSFKREDGAKNTPAGSAPHEPMPHEPMPDERMPDEHMSHGRISEKSLAPSELKLKAGLYIVATPIGNLRDITLRALDVLGAADTVLAEDTRQTRKLLEAYQIKASLSPYHDHNVAQRLPGILKFLEDGACVALVSDAGTPLVSDPGFKLARAAIAAGIDVIPVPGASAPLAALVTSGLPSDMFAFAGFLPTKSAARQTRLNALKSIPGTLIFFETGARIAASLDDMIAVMGADRPAALARELTKTFEETRRGTLSTLAHSVKDDPPRGEIVLLLGPDTEAGVWTAAAIDAALLPAVAEMGVKRASAHVAALSGWAKRDVYQRALALK